ncbi:hypothetical protein D3C84_1086940 [compost metagenome]
MLLPEPVEPIIPIVSPGMQWNDISCRTASPSCPSYEKDTWSNRTASPRIPASAALARSGIGSPSGCSGFSNTSIMRPADDLARTNMLNTIEIVISENKICSI